ncbi:MAG TPA: extracellular solute-binding protein [Gaiellaceae bacterium]|nr:extracellular solute-binding protein [Gaiellaceae bacterium]
MHTRPRRSLVALLVGLVFALAVVAAGCGGDGDGGAPEGSEDVSGSISLMGIWVGAEQEAIEGVLDGFRELYPNVDVTYLPAGDELVTRLSTAIEGGNPPDLATVAQPGTIADFAERGVIEPLDFAVDAAIDNLGESVVETGSVDGTLYGILVKVINKATIWYNVQAFEDAGVEPPETWDELLEVAQTLNASGIPAFSLAGADGWTLTDLFENVYIRTAGIEMYDQLAAHEIPWTDQSVKDALARMAEIYSDTDNIAGGRAGALQTDNAGSIARVLTDSPEAAMVIEGDFVPTAVETTLEPETGYNVFTFPSIDGSAPAVVAAGDFVAMFRDSPAAQALVEYLTSPEAAEAWASRGIGTPNKNLDDSVFPDEISRVTAGAVGEAEILRFDLSDLQPSAFGGTVGQGLFKLFQDFLSNPDDIDGITQQMEDAAAQAFGS